MIYIALIAGILLSMILFRKYLPNLLQTLSEGGMGSIAPLFATSLAVAFGGVVMNVPGFKSISEAILQIPGSPLISLTVLTALMSGITGSSSGALGIVLPQYAEHYLSLGLDPEIIHRVASVGSNILTLPPHGGALITFLTISGLTHKNGFKEGFIVLTGAAIVAQIIIISIASIFY